MTNAVFISTSLPNTEKPTRELLLQTQRDAWKKALEQEQQRSMQQMRSVKNPISNQESNSQTFTSIANALKQTHRTELPTQSSLHNSFSQLDTATQNSRSVLQNNFGQVIDQTNFSQAVYAENTNSSITENNQNLQASAILLELAERLKKQWPLKKMHVYMDEQGVAVSVRDADLFDQPTLLTFIEKLKQQLYQENKLLKRLTVNGKIVFVAE